MTELLEITTDGNENKIEEESGGIGTRLKAILPWQGQFAPLVAELEQEAENWILKVYACIAMEKTSL